jgi:hypothetical protein
MDAYLYRFRSLERLLGGELEDQQIYFAKPEDLNDPTEGFRDIVWKGDCILWENLFRHFILCLERAFSLLFIFREDLPLGWDHIPIYSRGHPSFTPQQKAMHEAILEEVLRAEPVRALIDILALRHVPTRRTELVAHLQSMHLSIVSVIHKTYVKRGLANDNISELAGFDGLEAIRKQVEAVQHVARMEAEGSTPEKTVEILFEAQAHIRSQLNLISLYNDGGEAKSANRNFVFLTFCEGYVRQLESLTFPNWYAACFMADYRNSSIWGTYGVNHTGVCLKFKTRLVQDRHTIRLKAKLGQGTNGPIVGWANHAFHPISYHAELHPIDFFRSLGRLPVGVLKKYWYADRTGNISTHGSQIFEADDDWRDEYWKTFFRDITRKLSDWRFEQEQRLILSGSVLDYSEESARLTRYEFDQLEGIIFGIKTPLDKKIEICKIIERKCCEQKRHKFNFYQAYYSRNSGSIEAAEMSLLDFAKLSAPPAL